MRVTPKAGDNAGTNAKAKPAKGKAAKIGTKAVSRASGTAKPSDPSKGKARSGKPSRHQPRATDLLPEAWRPVFQR